MTETKQTTEQTNVAKKSTTERNYVFIVTDNLVGSILALQGLITIFITDEYCDPSHKFNKDDPNNHIILLADNFSETQKVINQHSKQLRELNIKTDMATLNRTDFNKIPEKT